MLDPASVLPDLSDPVHWNLDSGHVCGVGSVSVAVARQRAGSSEDPNEWQVTVYTMLPGCRANGLQVAAYLWQEIERAKALPDPDARSARLSLLAPVNVVRGTTTGLPVFAEVLPSHSLAGALQRMHSALEAGAAPAVFLVMRGRPWRFHGLSAAEAAALSEDDVLYSVDGAAAVPGPGPAREAGPCQELSLLVAALPVLRALEACGVCHMDCKWDNIMPTDGPRRGPHIIDFDLSTFVGRDPSQQALCFPDEELECRFPLGATEVVAFDPVACTVQLVQGAEGRAAFFHAVRTAKFLPQWDVAFFVASLCLSCEEMFGSQLTTMSWLMPCVFDLGRLRSAGVRDTSMARALFRVQGPHAEEAVQYFMHRDALKRIEDALSAATASAASRGPK